MECVNTSKRVFYVVVHDIHPIQCIDHNWIVGITYDFGAMFVVVVNKDLSSSSVVSSIIAWDDKNYALWVGTKWRPETPISTIISFKHVELWSTTKHFILQERRLRLNVLVFYTLLYRLGLL